VKRMVIRLAFIAFLIILGILMYIIGQEHKVLVDNKEFKDYTYINNTIIVRIDDV